MSRIFSFLFLLFLLPTLALAQGAPSVSAGIHAASNGTGLTDFCDGSVFQRCVVKIVGGVVNISLSIVGVLLLGYMMYAGFLWMTSGGEKEGAETALKMIRQAVIGIVIIAASFAISSFVLSSLSTIAGGVTPPPTPPGPSSGSHNP